MAALSLDPLLSEAEIAHGHLCAGQILGVRMALLALNQLGIDDPRGRDRKRLVTFIEIDRCATDAIGVVTGCRLGKRALKLRDWGKMAATFVDVTLKLPDSSANISNTYKGIRIAALESSKERARELFPHIENKNAAQMLAYRELPDADLFSTEWVAIPLPPREFPGYKAGRVTCERCGEGINFDREVLQPTPVGTATLCQGCANPAARYYQPLAPGL